MVPTNATFGEPNREQLAQKKCSLLCSAPASQSRAEMVNEAESNNLISSLMGMEGRCALCMGLSNVLASQILWLTSILVVKFTSGFIMSPASLDMPRA